ncbi:MAG: class I SAM-dependent methyltransferase [Deltaproteobacteria bacterium]|nr:class I SAM-dependent methyltransferase [Deltaproteobacteria bacterium]
MNAEPMNADPCMLCNTSDFRVIHQKKQWQYRRCLNCDLVSLYPRPTPREFRDNYDQYLPMGSADIREWKKMMQPVVDKSADLIESQSKTGKGKLLDIGCGYGFFLEEMALRGWQVQGLEISRTGRQYARNQLNLEVYSEPLENLVFPENAFDVVTLFYVIEHVLEPLALLKAVKRILKPGGFVLLRWPHTTPIVRILGPLARKLDLYHTPYHIHDFSPKTIKRLLELSGFEAIETRITGYTLPAQRLSRFASIFFGCMGEAFYSLSGGNFLLPGISKTTLAGFVGYMVERRITTPPIFS